MLGKHKKKKNRDTVSFRQTLLTALGHAPLLAQMKRKPRRVCATRKNLAGKACSGNTVTAIRGVHRAGWMYVRTRRTCAPEGWGQ